MLTSPRNRMFALLTVIVTLAVGFRPGLGTAAAPDTFIPDDDLPALEAVIAQEMDFFNIPGAAVAVIAGDEVIYAEGFGLRDIENELPFTTDTVFRIGSTTKSMTALLVAQAVDQGLLTWDTPVTDLFSAFQTADADLTAQVTVRDLMGMNTGLASGLEAGFYWGDWNAADLLDGIGGQRIDGTFRETYHYNNEVYALAGYAPLVAAGDAPTLDSYANLIDRALFAPLGMESAVISDDENALGENVAQSYETSLLTGEPVRMTDPPIGIVAPAGAAWMHIEDMARYVIMQMNGGVTPEGDRIVSESALAETWAAGVPIAFDAPGIADTAYGMGWVTQTYNGVPVRFHDGGWAGYSTQMFILPADDLAIVVFANSSSGGTFGQAVSYSFIELAHDMEPAAVDLSHELMAGLDDQIAQARAFISTEIPAPDALTGQYANGWQIETRDAGVWLMRGEWEFQVGYAELVDQYFLVSGGAAGSPIAFTFDNAGTAQAFSIDLGEGGMLEVGRETP
ncbi:MAG: serine hydrolase domain-containing protein [bacterium]|nr:serine hydrolase domain-containing protein [bacterium]